MFKYFFRTFLVFLSIFVITSCNNDLCKSGNLEIQKCGTESKGSQSRVCISGEWSVWEECYIPSECLNGEIENQECGEDNKGSQTRTCINDKWSDWSECEMPIISCSDNEIKEGDSCGVNGVITQICNNGEWGEEICNEIDGEVRSFTVYIKTENDAVTSYLMDPNESAWNYFDSVHLGLREQAGGEVAYHPALRFENIQIPKNSEIIDAKLSFYPNSDVDNDKVRINIYAENSINSEPFDTSNYDTNRPDQRLKTTIKVPQNTNNPESWRIECVSDCCKDEPDCDRLWRYDCPQRKLDCWKKDTLITVPHDLSPIISEVISLNDWKAGNPITLFLESALNLNDGDQVGTRTINDFDDRGIEYNPSLTIKYKIVE
jgi:hypothetical protein